MTMSQQADYLSHPEPESGRGLHTQESGDAGLSSNMEHNFSDDDTERAVRVADNGCFVRHTSQGESDIVKHHEMIGKVWSLPTVSEHATGPKDKSHLVTAEEGLLKPSTEAVLQEDNIPPRASLIALSENRLKEETAKVAYRAVITEEQLHVEVADGSSIMGTKMEIVGNPEKPKHPPLGPRKRRNSNHHRKRAAGKNRKRYLLFLIAVFVPVSEGFPGAQAGKAADKGSKCFTCMDGNRCPKLWTIYHKDVPVFKGARNQTFPGCCGISPPTSVKSCVLCRDQSNITIICSEDVGAMDLEDWDGETITNFQPSACVWTCGSRPYRPHYGLFASLVLFLAVVATLVIYNCYQKKTGMKKVNSEEHCMTKKKSAVC